MSSSNRYIRYFHHRPWVYLRRPDSIALLFFLAVADLVVPTNMHYDRLHVLTNFFSTSAKQLRGPLNLKDKYNPAVVEADWYANLPTHATFNPTVRSRTISCCTLPHSRSHQPWQPGAIVQSATVPVHSTA